MMNENNSGTEYAPAIGMNWWDIFFLFLKNGFFRKGESEKHHRMAPIHLENMLYTRLYTFQTMLYCCGVNIQTANKLKIKAHMQSKYRA